MFKRSYQRVTSAVTKKESQKPVTMVPLVSLRTIIAIAMGLIVGVGLGVGYWLISPSLSSLDSTQQPTSQTGTGGFSEFIGSSHDGPFESEVNVQVVSPGLEYIALRDLQRMGEYYAAKANSLPFLEFLSQELAEQAPEYSHTANELDQMVRTRFDWNKDFPTIEMKVTCMTVQETSFLVEFVSQSFKNYLVAEEENKHHQEYQNKFKEIEATKAAILHPKRS